MLYEVITTSAYASIPSVNDAYNSGQFLDVATDNALTNVLTNNLNRMVEFSTVITSYSIHYTKLYDFFK